MVGIFEALVGLGAALGALSMLRWRPAFPARAGFWCLVTQGISIPAIGLGPMWVGGIACFTIGVTAGVASALLGAVFITTVDESFLGRMMSIQRLGDDVFMPLAMIGFGALAGASSVTVALCAFGGAMGLLMLWPLANPTLTSMQLPVLDQHSLDSQDEQAPSA